MARKCENRDRMEKYKYWNDFPATKHSFVMVMPDDFNRQLLIPNKFSECFKEKLCGWCTLVGPSGNKWIVRVTKKEDSDRVMFSDDGWPSFVQDHEIQLTDILTFHYIGNSSFKVSIFDASSGCEREKSYFAKNGYNSQSSEDEGEAHVLRNRQGKKKRLSVDEYGEADSGFEDSGDETKSKSIDIGSGWANSSSTNKCTRAKISQMYYESNRRAVEEEEKQIAIREAEKRMGNAKFPVISITMKPSFVYRGFNFTIPKYWAMAYMLRKTHEIELIVPKAKAKMNCWIVGCKWTTSQQCQIRKNWPKFVLDNNLEEHDVCVFELTRKDEATSKVALTVYIHRVVDNVVPLTVSRRMV